MFDIPVMFARQNLAEPVRAGIPQPGLQYRTITASTVIPRPREVVWAELEQDRHPAWCTPIDGENEYALRGDGKLAVGAVRIGGPYPIPPHGIRQVWWTEVTQVMPGWLVTVETYTGLFEHTETLVLSDHAQGTEARIQGSVRRVTTPEHADTAVALMTRMAEGHLRRAAQWQPGDPPRLIDAFPDQQGPKPRSTDESGRVSVP